MFNSFNRFEHSNPFSRLESSEINTIHSYKYTSRRNVWDLIRYSNINFGVRDKCYTPSRINSIMYKAHTVLYFTKNYNFNCRSIDNKRYRNMISVLCRNKDIKNKKKALKLIKGHKRRSVKPYWKD